MLTRVNPVPLLISVQSSTSSFKIPKWKAGNGKMYILWIVFCLMIAAAAAAAAAEHQERERGQFMLEKWEPVLKTDSGEIRAFRSRPWRGIPPSLNVGIITMRPSTLLVPQYVDANLILFLFTGEGKIGWIHKDDLVERRLKAGDILRVPAGSVFYLVNTGKGQPLQIIFSSDPDWRLDAPFQSFFIGGGDYSVLAGFDISTLSSALNTTPEVVREVTEVKGTDGPFVFYAGEEDDRPRQLAAALKQRRALVLDEKDEAVEERRSGTWTWAGILRSIFVGGSKEAAEENKARDGGSPVEAPEVYNIYDRKPDFKNSYGWSIEVNEHDYKPLKKSDISVYLVYLTAGAMMAPHVNTRATEYGVVVEGEGVVEVVYPNGTTAMREEVRVGDVFFVPRFLPFCQVAARGGPMKFFGFTTSARRNHPQFLVGASSVMRKMMGAELAAAFGWPEDDLKTLLKAQEESAILPSWPPARREKAEGFQGRRDGLGTV